MTSAARCAHCTSKPDPPLIYGSYGSLFASASRVRILAPDASLKYGLLPGALVSPEVGPLDFNSVANDRKGPGAPCSRGLANAHGGRFVLKRESRCTLSHLLEILPKRSIPGPPQRRQTYGNLTRPGRREKNASVDAIFSRKARSGARWPGGQATPKEGHPANKIS